MPMMGSLHKLHLAHTGPRPDTCPSPTSLDWYLNVLINNSQNTTP